MMGKEWYSSTVCDGIRKMLPTRDDQKTNTSTRTATAPAATAPAATAATAAVVAVAAAAGYATGKSSATHNILLPPGREDSPTERPYFECSGGKHASGRDPGGRRHYCWACPVAQAVVDYLYLAVGRFAYS